MENKYKHLYKTITDYIDNNNKLIYFYNNNSKHLLFLFITFHWEPAIILIS